jgi:hypothetical protein
MQGKSILVSLPKNLAWTQQQWCTLCNPHHESLWSTLLLRGKSHTDQYNKTLSAIRHFDVRFCFSPHLSPWRSTQKRKHLVPYRLWYGTVQTGLLGAVCSHVTARQSFNYKWEAAGWGEKYMFMFSYDSPEGHRGQLTYTFVVRILTMSLT